MTFNVFDGDGYFIKSFNTEKLAISFIKKDKSHETLKIVFGEILGNNEEFEK